MPKHGIKDVIWLDFYFYLLPLDVLSRFDMRQYRGCWYPGSMRRQVISIHDID